MLTGFAQVKGLGKMSAISPVIQLQHAGKPTMCIGALLLSRFFQYGHFDWN